MEELRISTLFAAAQNGNTDDVKLLLSAADANVSDSEGFTPLHFAAAHGHTSCVAALLSSGARVDAVSLCGRSALFVASESGQTHCVKELLDSGADRSISTTDGCSPLHAAVLSGNLGLLRLLLYHASPPVAAVTPPVATVKLTIPPELLNQTNTDGWTAAHIAAAHGHKECLDELCSHREQNLEIRDRWDRTIHDLATDDCKDLLENLFSYRVHVEVRCSAALGDCALVAGRTLDHLELGSVEIDRFMDWSQLWSEVARTFMDYVRSLCESPDPDQDPSQEQDRALGLSHGSIKSIYIGDREWSVGEEVSLCPWDLVRKPPAPGISVRLHGLSQSRLDEVCLSSLIPLSTLNNYVRLVEQYGNLMLHGVEGSLQENLAAVVAHCIQRKQEGAGLRCDVVRIEVDPSLTRDQMLDALVQAGLLVPVGCEGGEAVVVTLEHLERAPSLSALMGELCQALDHRGPLHTLHTATGPHWLLQGSYIITTLCKPRLQGSELRLQQHLRWISLRWDQEPLSGLLSRTLRARIQSSAESPDSSVSRSALWVTRFWRRLNSCLCRLGTTEALIGPGPFLSCPVSSSEDVLRFLCDLWNSVVVPRIEAAIVSRVSPRLSPLPHTQGHSTGQKALVKAALGIVLNRAVLPDCPLSRSEMERFLPEFSGGPSPLSKPSSDPEPRPGLHPGSKPGSVSPRVRRKRDHRLRRSNTTPRKRGVCGAGLGTAGSFCEGSQSTSDIHFISGDLHRSGGLSLFSDEETDLIRELQTMSCSRSEPDISKTPASPPPISRSRLPLRASRANNPRPSTNTTTTTTTTTTTAAHSTTAPSCPDDNQHFLNNNYLHSSADAVWILHENYITHNPPLLPR